MVTRHGLMERVGPVPDVDALDAIGNSPFHREGLLDGMLRDRREISSNLDARVSGLRKRVLPLVGNQGRLHGVEGQRGRSLQEVPVFLLRGRGRGRG